MMNRSLKIVGLGLFGGMLFLGGIVLGRWSLMTQHRAYFFMDNGPEDGQYADSFNEFVKRWNRFVTSSDGFIPADPYKGLIEAGVVESYAELRGIVFSAQLPPRIHPELVMNPKRLVFRTDSKHSERQLWCYADGTWERAPSGPEFARAFNESQYDLDEAGYPSWTSMNEKNSWIEQHRSTLKWDANRRMYTPLKLVRDGAEGF